MVMVNSRSSLSALLLLLIPTLCLGSSVIWKQYNYQVELKTWTDARQFCQEHYFDLSKNARIFFRFFLENAISQVWIGVHRDPKNESVWRYITAHGEELPGKDVTGNFIWARGEKDGYCVFANVTDAKWYSAKCSQERSFYCSNGNLVYQYNEFQSWHGAQKHCQKKHNDLSSVTLANTNQFKGGWIGLYRVAENQWRWSDNDASDYRNWAPGQPLVRDCGVFAATQGLWLSKPCSEKLGFVCYAYNLVLVKESKTWEEALVHCRSMTSKCVRKRPCKYEYELVSLQKDELSYTTNLMKGATTDEVWTGLRFLAGAWFWVNKEGMNHQTEMPSCPSTWQHCGIVSKTDGLSLQARDCSERKNFICYKKTVWTTQEWNDTQTNAEEPLIYL